MEYFVILNGNQAGPFPKEQLPYIGVRPDTFVWRQGLPEWVKAEMLPELADIFMSDSAFGGYATQQPPVNPVYPGSQVNPGSPENPYTIYGRQPGPIQHTNWMPWAIVGTVFGALFSCIGMIFGIIGITNASKANKYYAAGFFDEGERSNSSARTMTIIALVLGGIGLLLTVSGVTGTLSQQLLNLAN